ncbi:hypothetical protein JL09_g6327, partial [Pichia kudriavzevii]
SLSDGFEASEERTKELEAANLELRDQIQNMQKKYDETVAKYKEEIENLKRQHTVEIELLKNNLNINEGQQSELESKLGKANEEIVKLAKTVEEKSACFKKISLEKEKVIDEVNKLRLEKEELEQSLKYTKKSSSGEIGDLEGKLEKSAELL